MTATRTARMLTRYNRWANDLIFAAVAALPAGEATKPRATLFKNMVHTLNHNYVIDRIFQAHLERRSTAIRRATRPRRRRSRSSRARSAASTTGTSPGATRSRRRARRAAEFAFVGGGQGAMTRGEMLLHIVNHTSYHRGFVADMFYQVPARPPVTDLTVFLRDACPPL